eukprot:g4725.t1
MFALVAMTTASERIFFKVMVDNVARYRYLLAQLLLLVNLAIATSVCVYRAVRAYCARIWKRSSPEEDSDDEEDTEESKAISVPFFNFGFCDVLILGILEGLAFFGLIVPATMVPAFASVILVQFEIPLTILIGHFSGKICRGGFGRRDSFWGSGSDGRNRGSRRRRGRSRGSNRGDDRRRRDGRRSDADLASATPTHRLVGATVVVIALALLVGPLAVRVSGEAREEENVRRQQLFSSLLFLAAGVPAVLSRYWQNRMLRNDPIDPWQLSTAKLLIQCIFGMCAIVALVRLQFAGLDADGDIWSVGNGTDTLSENLKHGFPCVFAASGGSDDSDPATTYECSAVYAYAFGFVALGAFKSFATVCATHYFGHLAPLHGAAWVGSLVAFFALLPWNFSDGVSRDVWPIKSEASVEGPLWRHALLYAVAPVLFFAGMACTYGFDLIRFGRSRRRETKRRGVAVPVSKDMLPLTTEAAFPESSKG